METQELSLRVAAPQSKSSRWWFAGHPIRQLFLLFLFSLPFVNPYIHGDGVGYYAYVRAPLIQHNLHFEEDWRRANQRFAENRTKPGGKLDANQYTETGYVANLFSVGPALLWSPMLLATHAAVLLFDHWGGAVPADGFSLPYRLAMATGTAFYGFLGLLLSYLLASKYVEQRWAFLATLGIWAATSLPVYMYFNPAWSHAHSAFAVALFLWYWDRTRPARTTRQWLVFGLIAGLMVDTYFPNGALLLIPLIEALRGYGRFVRLQDGASMLRDLGRHVSFVSAFFLGVLPTLFTRDIIFGGPLRFGSYSRLPWDWTAPNWFLVLFSSDHGLLTWTPVVMLALAGLFCLKHEAKEVALYGGIAFLCFYYVIASYPSWDGLSSFGNRFFISLTPVFVLGLAGLLDGFARWWGHPRRSFPVACGVVGLLILWNLGFIFQWGTQMIPARGPISWREMVHNQYAAVPGRVAQDLDAYFLHRKTMMRKIEEQDMKRYPQEVK